jgi:hypothetical protein
MLRNITWGNYVIAISTLIVIWYIGLILRYYYEELKQVLSGKRKIGYSSFGKRNKEQSDQKHKEQQSSTLKLTTSFSESFSTLEDAEELSEKLIKAIAESVERNLSRQEFTNYLKLILDEYPYVKNSSLRENVNNLIFSECAKHPQLHLTFSQADYLWEEAI